MENTPYKTGNIYCLKHFIVKMSLSKIAIVSIVTVFLGYLIYISNGRSLWGRVSSSGPGVDHGSDALPLSRRLLRGSERDEGFGDRAFRVKDEQLWNEIEDEFEKFKRESTPSTPFSSLPGNRDLLTNSRSFHFWGRQLDSENPQRVELAERIFSMALSYRKLSPEEEHKNPDILAANRIYRVMSSATKLLDEERQNLKLLIEGGILPEGVKAADLTKKIGEEDNDGNIKIISELPGNSDQLVIEDARMIVEYFAPKLRSENAESQEEVLRVLNFYTYGLYEEDGAEFWLDALVNLDNLKEFFGE